MKKYEFHEAANIFPVIEGEEFESFKRSIETEGLLTPIALWDGKIIDGRNRYRAALEVGAEPEFVDATDKEQSPVGYALALNLERRHLTESQRALVGARAKGLYAERAKERVKAHGGTAPGKKKAETPMANLPGVSGPAREQAAAAVKVSGRTIDHAVKVIEKGSKELVAAVERGDVKVSTAAKLAEKPKSEQTAAVRQGPAAVREAVKPKVDPRDAEPPGYAFIIGGLHIAVAAMEKLHQEHKSITQLIRAEKWESHHIDYARLQVEELLGALPSVAKGLAK